MPYCTQSIESSGLLSATNHHVEFSADGKYYTDLWSRIDLPPYNTEDNKQLMVPEHADIIKLAAAGWHAPEVFKAKGRDGATGIRGIINRPANFDPHKKYPVVENIYAGPQGSFVPKSLLIFSWSKRRSRNSGPMGTLHHTESSCAAF